MAYLTLIRHAQTSFNDREIFMGCKDVGCTESGLAAAKKLGVQLCGNSFSFYFTSPLRRSRETLECIFPDVQVREHLGLRERNLGRWEGRKKSDIRRDFPDAFLPDGNIDPRFTPVEGEPLDDFIRRVQGFLSFVKSLEEARHIIAVTHNGVIRVVRHLVEEVPVECIFGSSEPFLEPQKFELSGSTFMDVVYSG